MTVDLLAHWVDDVPLALLLIMAHMGIGGVLSRTITIHPITLAHIYATKARVVGS
jgi:hypothetical protein